MAIYLDDKRLVKQLLDGDKRAFDSFFDDNFARLYRFAIARMPDDPQSARDVVQVTLTKALRSMHTYRAESALFTWLCAICRNELSDWLARNAH
jgi:RNA polymerase sigma-70 factor, ECF subfamily